MVGWVIDDFGRCLRPALMMLRLSKHAHTAAGLRRVPVSAAITNAKLQKTTVGTDYDIVYKPTTITTCRPHITFGRAAFTKITYCITVGFSALLTLYLLY
jgi:hypothetical protein